MGAVGTRFEFGVELHADEESFFITGQLDGLDDIAVGGFARDNEPCRFKSGGVFVIDFVAQVVTL